MDATLNERVEKSLNSHINRFEKSVVEQLLREPLSENLNVTGSEVQIQTRKWERQITQIINRLTSVKVIQDCDQLVDLLRKIGVSVKQIELSQANIGSSEQMKAEQQL